jgi:hypothetical protein
MAPAPTPAQTLLYVIFKMNWCCGVGVLKEPLHFGVAEPLEPELFIVEYLREFEAICKKALARESGVQMELFDEKKTGGRKSRDRVPLKVSKIFLKKFES